MVKKVISLICVFVLGLAIGIGSMFLWDNYQNHKATIQADKISSDKVTILSQDEINEIGMKAGKEAAKEILNK